MQTLVVDCPTGLAGDMLLAASLDLGVPRQVITEPLDALGLGDAYRLVVEESTNGGRRWCFPQPPGDRRRPDQGRPAAR